MRRRLHIAVFAIAAAFAIFIATPPVRASNYSRVFINGTPVPVNFNDGDSFRIFGGQYRSSQCRLAGFNTLESYGGVHQWGSWHPYELYVNAKMATYHARRGVWHCTTDGSRDGYGRLLVYCPDLAVSHIRNGLAHHYSIDDNPARPEYLRAQLEAIRNRRGMWAHGVPEFIMTSLHSAHESPGRASNSNRLISTRDGHTERMVHNDTYSECQWVCHDGERVADPQEIRQAARELRSDRELSPHLTGLFNLHLMELASRYARTQELPSYVTGPARRMIEARLRRMRQQGRLSEARRVRGSCALYVEFTRRYGRNRASCLRGHGNWHHGSH